MDDFIDQIRNHLLGDGNVAGINSEPGDFGLDVGLTDGQEFHIEFTRLN